jgi:AcrR family transcriptional regulator
VGAPPTPRPMRADARRNYERIVAIAREAFAEHGAEAPLDDIARRAGVGAGTLYRHFPGREALIEAVYRDDIERLAGQAHELIKEHDPEEALARWMRAQVQFVSRKRGLASTLKALLDKDSETFALCKTMMNDAVEALLSGAQSSGVVRTDIRPRDLLLLGHGVGMATESQPEAADRLLRIMLDGLRPPTA